MEQGGLPARPVPGVLIGEGMQTEIYCEHREDPDNGVMGQQSSKNQQLPTVPAISQRHTTRSPGRPSETAWIPG